MAWELFGESLREMVKYFTKILSVKYFTQICLDWFSWLKIFYFWLNILLQNKHYKIKKYFPTDILRENKHIINFMYKILVF